ncbi:MAG: RES family NAD+ phosphorylase [Bryobacteraceae bacterium]
MTDPPIRSFNWETSHRLIPSCHSTAFSALTDSAIALEHLELLAGATNDLIRGEERGLIGISPYELLYGISNAHVVNACFTHASRDGSRFNDHTRGAWYAADRIEASIAEVVYHKSRRLSDLIVPRGPNARPAGDSATYDDWLAEFRATFHVLDPAAEFAEYLQPEPVPHCYASSQALARHLLHHRSNGLAYPSVRHAGSWCIACFRPALVYNIRKSQRFRLILTAIPAGYDYSIETNESSGA